VFRFKDRIHDPTMTSGTAAARIPSLLAIPAETVGQQNMLQLIQLRWIAVIGQIITIAFVSLVFEIRLPLLAMSAVLCVLIGLNLVSIYRSRKSVDVSNGELMTGLMMDVAGLTVLLYLSGGSTNPFVFLYLLQVTIGAVLLQAWSTWTMVIATSVCFIGLTRFYLPLDTHSITADTLFRLNTIGMLICFALDAGLLVVFVSRINAILRRRDARLADLRQHAAEEDHIVRMGLLASGAAHELGTPLATLSVILGDWRRMPVFRDDPELLQEIGDMQAEVQRCKTIVTGILMAAGEARGESPVATTVAGFLDELVEDWRGSRPVRNFEYNDENIDADFPIISDSALKQIVSTVLDNALESSPDWVGLTAWCSHGVLSLEIRDHGPGFKPEMLKQIGKPYQSSKGRPGGGLGLFLVVNVVRKLGGTVTAENTFIGPGAAVTLNLPLAALSIERSQHGSR